MVLIYDSDILDIAILKAITFKRMNPLKTMKANVKKKTVIWIFTFEYCRVSFLMKNQRFCIIFLFV